MRRITYLCILAVLFIGVAPAGSITYQVSELGQSLFRLSYTVTDISFSVDQELDIRFDPALYSTLSNGVAPAGFDLLLLQPNNPPGTPGDFSALALTDIPSLTAMFSVDVLMLGPGRPVEQSYWINQLDQQGNLVSTVASGTTVDATTPEPATLPLAGVALLIGGAARVVRRRFLGTS
jgi:hypothetical protein